MLSFFFFQAEDGIRDLVRSRGLGDVYKRQNLDYDWVNEFTPRITLQMLKNGSWEDSLATDKEGSIAVSYTHLTLPTSDLV